MNQDFLKDLNEAQRAAVTDVEGPSMVIAGAGSGKTRVLTSRLAYIISERYADAFECLALTFTNKAAREMRERIEAMIGTDAKNIWMGTFHSIFARILRYEGEKIGYTSNFTILDSDDSLSLIRKIIKEMNLDDKKFKPKIMRNKISSAKNAMIDADTYAAEFVTDQITNIAANVYKKYSVRLFDANSMDFDDLLMKPIELFEKHPDVLEKYQRRFRYIMVDEYQDTNHAQYLITKMLADLYHNITVVGDDAQSIYSFRGANIQNILNFRKDYPKLKLFKLEQNYRSTENIVEAANSIIARNKNQIQKTVFTQNDKGDLIRVLEAKSDIEEAKMVTDQIREQKMRHSYKHEDFAILYRTNAQSRAVETELRRAGIPYRIFGGLSFYHRKEIKDVVAYLKLSVNPRDEAALDRVINYPARGIGKTSLNKIAILADQNGIPLWKVLDNIEHFGFNSRLTTPVRRFVDQVKRYGIKAKKEQAYDVASFIAKDTGILKELHADKEIDSLSRWENVQELLNAAKEFSEDPEREDHSLGAFLGEISLFTDQDDKNKDGDYVTLMTIHSSKGLEFPSVFIVGLEEELFPNSMALETRADLEEERRLFYVAITRAKHSLSVAYARSRYRYGSLHFSEPSRFVKEIAEEYLHFPRRPKRPDHLSTMPAPVTQALPARKTSISVLRAQAKNEIPGDDLKGLTVGMEVEHSRFGEGKVLALEGEGALRKASVFFKKKGQKVLLLKYAKLKILN